jgi:hypothetical protein
MKPNGGHPMNRVLTLLLFSFLAVGCVTYQRRTIILERSEGLSIKQDEVEEIWKLVCNLTHTSLTFPPPRIYFETFNPSRMDTTWLAWQKEWMKKAKLDAYPRGDTYEGFFYTGTSVIQIDPNFFIKNDKDHLDPRTKEDARREGKRIIAHEMLHYIFEQKGVPPYLHHCIMDQGGYDRAIMSFVYQKPVQRTFLEGICEKTPKELIDLGIKHSQASPETH